MDTLFTVESLLLGIIQAKDIGDLQALKVAYLPKESIIARPPLYSKPATVLLPLTTVRLRDSPQCRVAYPARSSPPRSTRALLQTIRPE
jgi:hypothetical protein